MTTFNIGLVTIGASVLLLGLLSTPIKRLSLSTPLIALLLGVALGPYALGLLDPSTWGARSLLLEEAARLTVAVSLMGIALRLPRRYPRKHAVSLAIVLGPVMVAMWLVSGAVSYVILGVPLAVAFLIGAVVTPTDPVVASSIVQGPIAERHLPPRLRHFLSSESGANDGLAYPFVFLVILLTRAPAGEALPEWLLRVLLWEVGGAIVLGAVLGYAAGILMEWAHVRRLAPETSFLIYSLALTFVVVAATKLAGTDDLLAVFVSGLVFATTITDEESREEENVQEAVNDFFLLPVFILLGLSLPWREWAELGWRGVALAVAVLALRRLPAFLALAPLMRSVRGPREAAFLGWFGPIGVAALFYANLALRETDMTMVWTAGSLIVCASVLAHGVTATPLTRLLGRRESTGTAIPINTRRK